MTDFEKRITFPCAAFERRHDNPERDYGVGCVIAQFALIGPDGAISWQMGTGWYLPHVTERFEKEGHSHAFKPMGYAVDIHSPRVLFPDMSPEPDTEACDLLGGPCWGDVSFLAGDQFMTTLIEHGEDGVWKLMQEWYEAHLSEAARV